MLEFGLIGFPISHSESPRLFRESYPEHFDGRAEEWTYDLIEEEDFGKAWRRFIDGGYRAVNVTAPFKESACRMADFPSEEVTRLRSANILVRKDDGIYAYNSDYLGVKRIIASLEGVHTCAVIGTGGAGRAAFAAAQDSGLSARSFHHDEISAGVESDLIIYTLPRACEGSDRLDSRFLLEANYLNPCLEGHRGYISGREWLRLQAETGFPLFFK